MSSPTPETWGEDLLGEPYLLNLLYRSFRRLQGTLFPLVEAQGHPGIGLPETRILVAVGDSEVPVHTLAERTGTSRQYVSRLVGGLEERGYLKRGPAAKDGRSTLVSMGAQGRRYLADLHAAKQTLDRAIAAQVGEERLAVLVQTLEELAGGGPSGA